METVHDIRSVGPSEGTRAPVETGVIPSRAPMRCNGAGDLRCCRSHGHEVRLPKLSEMKDTELLQAFEHMIGRANDMVANALLAEIERRNLDI